MKLIRLCCLAAVLAVPGVAGARTVSCDAQFNLKSVDSGIPINIKFVNRSNAYRSTTWIDYSGSFVQYQGLNDNEGYVQPTLVGHPWMITDGPGNCKAIFIPEEGDTQFIIR